MQRLSFFGLRKRAVIGVAVLLILGAALACAASDVDVFKGQQVYVPVYSHIYGGNAQMPFYLAVTVSIRNTDAANPIQIDVADYYDSQGRLLKKYAQKPILIAPFSSADIVIEEADKSGGSGAFFIVHWRCPKEVNPPLIESIMIGTHRQQGISFTSRGQVLKID